MANLTQTIGDYRQYQVTITKNGVPVDLTGAQELNFTLQLSGGDIFATFGLGTEVTIPSPTTGVGIVTITPAAQSSWIVQNYSLIYTWSLVDEFGNPSLAVDTGTFTLTPPPGSALLGP